MKEFVFDLHSIITIEAEDEEAARKIFGIYQNMIQSSIIIALNQWNCQMNIILRINDYGCSRID